MGLRHQLAVYSPISVGALAAAARGAIGFGSESLEELTALLRSEYSAESVVLCGSGTQALQLAIEVARQEVGHQAVVALPGFTCFDVASAAIGANGPVALYDLDPLSLSPDLTSLEQVLASGAKVVVIAPLYGVPVDWQSVQRLALSHGAVVVEDAAQGHGATYRGKPLGALGDVSTLSFGRGKGWTGGSGGAVLVRRLPSHASPSLQQPPRFDVRTVVQLEAQFILGRPSLYALPRSLPGLSLGETVYHPPRRPTVMSRATAGAVLATRGASLIEAEGRRLTAKWLRDQVRANRSIREITSAAGSDGASGFLRFPVLISKGMSGLVDPAAAERLGVASTYPLTLADLPPLAPLVVNAQMPLPGASRLVRELVTLPSHSLMSNRDRALLVGLIGARVAD